MFMNALYDLAEANGCEWKTLREALIHDPRIGESHTEPVHSSGRGAGGHCLIKDFEAFRHLYNDTVTDTEGQAMLRTMAQYNIKLLSESQKDIDLLTGVYGEELKTKD